MTNTQADRTIVHVISSLEVGGAQQILIEVCRALEGQGYHFVVISLTRETALADRLRKLGCRVYCLGMSARSVFSMWRLCSIIRTERPTLVQTWLYHADLLGGMAARFLGVPAVWSVHHASNHFEGDSVSIRMLTRVLALLSRWIPEAIIYCSEDALQVHEAFGYTAKKSLVIANGVDLQRFRPNSGLRDRMRNEVGAGKDTVLVGMLGRLARVKGHDIFFEMAKKVQRVDRNIEFVLAGTHLGGPNAGLARFVDVDSLGPAFHFLGERSDIEAVMNGLDIVVCPSRSESFGMVVVEALACGVPVIASDLPAMRRLLMPEYLIATGDAKGFAQKLQEMAEQIRQKIVVLDKSATSELVNRYDKESMIEKYRGLYERIF